MKLTKQTIALLLTFGAISQTAQAATVWTAQLISTTSTELVDGTSTDRYKLHIVVDENTLNSPLYSELTVTDIYLDHLGGVADIDPAALLTTSSSVLANSDTLDYYLTNDLVNDPVFLGYYGSLGEGWASMVTSNGNLRSVGDTSLFQLVCDGTDSCDVGGIKGTSLLNPNTSVWEDEFVYQLIQDFYAPNPPIGHTSIVNWKATAISAVPVPASVWLFGSGLFGLIGIARRKKS